MLSKKTEKVVNKHLDKMFKELKTLKNFEECEWDGKIEKVPYNEDTMPREQLCELITDLIVDKYMR